MNLKELPKGRNIAYRRYGWELGLMFAYNEQTKKFMYCTYKSYGIEFSTSYVGSAVLGASDLEAVNKSENKRKTKMNKDYIGTYGVVEVEYVKSFNDVALGIDTYTFKVDLKLHKKIKAGDLVVVDSRSGIALARVTEKYSLDLLQKNIEASNRAKAWIVNTVNTKDHTKRIEDTERRKFIMKELEDRKKAIEEKAVWKMLAETDPTAATLLQELEDLQ